MDVMKHYFQHYILSRYLNLISNIFDQKLHFEAILITD